MLAHTAARGGALLRAPARGPTPFKPCSALPQLPSRSRIAFKDSFETLRTSATKTDGGATKYTPKNARDAIETGTLVLKDKQDYVEAVRLYNLAMQMNPNDDEARAALYNMGCAYAKQKQWQKSTDAILRAINDYQLKLSVALRVGVARIPTNPAVLAGQPRAPH